ncbi:hypothetical protein THRCLA_00614 [Thraustotheca clavata]|uniref:RING-type domain-containing protein n=1 Tax=Thraustotheca clavata TaxID=74557 RepID=A0A1W0AAN2_9STRA|nr:hypothetical protein THRCLA_00614 [Thraustotheca clavata]
MEKCIKKTEKLYRKAVNREYYRDKCRYKEEYYERDAIKATKWRRRTIEANEKIRKAYIKLEKAFDPTVFVAEQGIWFAAKYGLDGALRRAIGRTRNVEYVDPKTNQTPFIMACIGGHLECAKILFNAHANVMAVNLAGFTALHCAAQFGQFEIVQWLLTLPTVDPYAKSLSTMTPLEVTRTACAMGDKFGHLVKSIHLLEQKLLVFSGWFYESIQDSIANKYILSTVGLNCHSWKLRSVLVLSTGHDSSTLEFVLYDQRENGQRPSVPDSFLIYEKGDPVSMPGTKRNINNREHTFSFNAIQKTHVTDAGVFQRVECAAPDAAALQKWVAFFEEYFVQASIHSAHPSEAHSFIEPPHRDNLSRRQSSSAASFGPPPSQNRRQSSATASLVSQSSQELFPSVPPPQYNDLFPMPAKHLAVDFEEEPRRFTATAPSFCEAQPIDMQFSTLEVNEITTAASAPSTNECVVCFDGPKAGVCVPCGHNAVCMACADRLMSTEEKHCPVCRADIREIIPIFSTFHIINLQSSTQSYSNFSTTPSTTKPPTLQIYPNPISTILEETSWTSIQEQSQASFRFFVAQMLRTLFEWAVTFVQPDAALWYAVKNNDVDAVNGFLSRNDIEAVRSALEVTDSEGLTPLLMACVRGHVQVVQALLEKDQVHNIVQKQTDHHGNGPVHHACMHGRSEVVQYLVSQLGISPYLLNTSGQSPLDVTRSIYEREYGDVPKQFLDCIDILEQRCTVFEGWVYESTDNIASKTLGVTSLQSWKRRYCVVLRTALRTHFELVLYDFTAESRDDVNWQRSSTPTSITLFQIGADSITFNSKQKFFNSKPFAFTLQCIRKDTSYTSLPTMLHQPIEFAAVTADGYAAWTNFLVTDAVYQVSLAQID